MDHPKFSPFNVSEAIYKTVNGQNIPAYVLIPKEIKPGNHPVIIRWHGGFLITGSALYPDWFANWTVDWALSHSAIMIAPNHRLLPESTGPEILSDINDFYSWLSTELPGYLSTINSSITADLSKVVVMGESAGGYIAILSGLNAAKYSRLDIKSVLAQFPALDFRSPFFAEPGVKTILGAPQVPSAVLETHIAGMEKGKIVTSVFPPGRMDLCLVAVQQGKFLELLGDMPELYPFDVLDKVEKKDVPYMSIFHGKQDSAVPVEGSEKFLEKAEKVLGAGKVDLYIGEGEHGFDKEVTTATPWLKEVLRKVDGAWLD